MPAGARASTLRAELRELALLTVPLFLTHAGTMLLGLVDTAVVGRLGEVPLAAVGLGNSLYFTIAMLGFGLMLGLDPLIAQAIGAGEEGRARHLLWQGSLLAILVVIPLALVTWALSLALEPLGIEAAVAREVRPYVLSRLAGMLPFLLLAACRSYLQARAKTRALVIGVVVANAINLPLSWALCFGDEGLERLGLPALSVPALGTAGAGWASSAATAAQLVISILAIRAIGGESHAAFRRADARLVTKIARLGAPISLQLVSEFGSFAIVTFLMGVIGSRALSSHNVALMLASATFQLALALSAATAVRVGHGVGRADARGTRRSGVIGIVCGALGMSAASLLFVAVPAPLSRIVTDQPEVIAASVSLLAVAAAFQLSDGVQCVAAGALRGAGDTVFPFAANLVGHYVLGLPVGILLSFVLGWGAVGLWWGLSVGLTAVAIALTARFLRLASRPIARS